MDEATKAALESGRPVTVFNIGSVGQMNPAATTVTNNYYGDQFAPKQETAEGEAGGDGEDPALKTQRVVNASQKLTTGKKSKRGMKVKDATYTYKYQKECPLAITNLYQALISAKWIDASTKKEDFQKLFSGESATFTIKWRRDSIQLLWYLFKLIKDRDYVTRPAGVSVWQIEKCHFVDKNDRVIESWSSQHEPQHFKDTVVKMVDLLDPLEAVLDQFDRQEQRLDRDTARRLLKERLNANRRHDDDDD